MERTKRLEYWEIEKCLIMTKGIFVANKNSRNAIHYGCRLVLDNGYLYASLGERGERYDAQDPAVHAGAIISWREADRLVAALGLHCAVPAWSRR